MVERGEAPDMAQISAYSDYAAEGRLYRADQLLSIPTQADFLPTLAEAGEIHHAQYGLPFVASTRLLFYNKALFEEAGITKAPQTWAEVAQAAQALREIGVRMPYGLPFGPEEAEAETMLWMLSGGGDYTDSLGSYVIDSPENVETFEWLRDTLVSKGLSGSEPGVTNREEVFVTFLEGEVGMLSGHPSLIKEAEKRGVEYGMAPLPGRNGPSEMTVGVADWMMAFKQNGHSKEIGTFLDFVYSEENVLNFADRYDLLPVTLSAHQAMRENKKHRHLWEFLDQLPRAHSYPVNKTSWPQVDKAIKEKIGRAVQPGGDPASVLGEIQREAETTENAVR
jgi:multiple sugar transport system substrate-binding protein